jgi:hypothetical protein
MRFPFDRLCAAIQHHVSPEVAGRMHQALAGLRADRSAAQDLPYDLIGQDEIGEVLVRALVPHEGARMAGLPLTRAVVHLGETVAEFDAEAAAAHPLFPWLGLTAAEALGAIVLDAATMAGLAFDKAIPLIVSVIERDGREPCALAAYNLPTNAGVARLYAYYGSEGEVPSRRVIHEVKGHALTQAGCELLSPGKQTAAGPPAGDVAAAVDNPLTSTVH